MFLLASFFAKRPLLRLDQERVTLEEPPPDWRSRVERVSSA